MTRIIVVCSGKGGVGKTTVAANLAMALQRQGMRVAIVDCNLTTSHLSLLFGTYFYPVTLNDYLRKRTDFGDAIYLQSSGLKLVPASLKLGELSEVDVPGLRWNLREAFKDMDFVIIDAAPGIGREALTAIQLADEVLFVATPTLPSLVDVAKMKKLIDSIYGIGGYRPFCLGVVLNRVRGRRYEATLQEVRDFTGLPVIGVVPEDERVLECANRGCILTESHKGSPASRSIYNLARRLSGRAAYQKSNGLVDRLFESVRSLKPMAYQ